MQVYRYQRQQQSKEVGEIVACLGKQRQRVRANSGKHQQHDVGQGYDEGKPQNARGSFVSVVAGMRVHTSSLRWAGERFKTQQ